MTAAIQAVSHLVSVIQAEFASRARTGPAPSRAGIRPESGVDKGADIESLISLRIRSIACDDPKRRRKAFRVFLESILLARFGKQLMHDPKFYDMVDAVQDVMEADSELNALIQAAIDHLLLNQLSGDA